MVQTIPIKPETTPYESSSTLSTGTDIILEWESITSNIHTGGSPITQYHIYLDGVKTKSVNALTVTFDSSDITLGTTY
jgi:hypothetical protein